MYSTCIHNNRLNSCVRCNRQYRSSTPNPVAQGIFCKHGWNKYHNIDPETGLLPCRDPLCVARRTYTPRGTGTPRVTGTPRGTVTPRGRGGIVKKGSTARLVSPVKPVELFQDKIAEIDEIDRPFEEIDLENPFGIDPVFDDEMEGG